MNRVIFVGFNDEKQAYEGDRALRDMHRDGSITLYADAVIAKKPNGEVVVRERAGEGPVGTAGGLLTGSLIGLLGGPLGVAVGATAGTAIGAAADLTRAGIGSDFLEDVGEHLLPGKAAVIAEIDEQWQLPLDTRMESLGGTLLRRTRTQIEDAYFEREIEAQQKELASLQAEKEAELKAEQTKKSAERNAKIQAKIDEAKHKVQDKQNEVAARIRSLQEEGEEKVAALQAQMTTANAETKADLDRRLAEVRADYRERTKMLSEALERRKAAHTTA